MPVFYRSKQIIPGPFVSLTRNIVRSQDGTARQHGWKAVVKGKMMATRGSPDKSYAPSSTDPMDWFYTGSYNPPSSVPSDPSPSLVEPEHRLARLRDKMASMQALFDVDGGWFEIQPFDGSAPTKFQPRIDSVEFAEGKWFEYVEYTVSMDTDCVYFGNTQLCTLGQADNLPEEQWTLEQADEFGRTYKLTHTVSSMSKKRFDADGDLIAEGWEIARDIVIGGPLAGDNAVNLLGFDQDQLTATGVLDLGDFRPFNHVRSQNTDEAQGKFSVTEVWLCFNPDDNFGDVQTGNAIEDLQVDTRYSIETGLFTVSINGNINGLEERDAVTREVTKTRYENALLRFNPIYASNTIPFNRAQTYSGKTLNPDPVGSTVARNDRHGTINYSVEYNNRAALTIAGALSEIVVVTIDHKADVFAAIGVIGRPAGPILQPIGSKTEQSISINVDVVLPAARYGETIPTAPVYDTLAKALTIIGIPTQMFVKSDRENWVERTGRYNRSSTFIWQ